MFQPGIVVRHLAAIHSRGLLRLSDLGQEPESDRLGALQTQGIAVCKAGVDASKH